MPEKQKSKDENNSDKNWIELHGHYSKNWKNKSKNSWETLKLNTVLSSALISLTIYSIIYVYTSDFFWNTDLLTSTDRFLVRLALVSIPITLLLINFKLQQNFNRQCRRMYKTGTILIKIEERLGLYEDRIDKKFFSDDRWYVPDNWINVKFPKTEKFVEHWMKEKDAFYKNMNWLFWIFGIIAVVLIGFEILLILRPILNF